MRKIELTVKLEMQVEDLHGRDQEVWLEKLALHASVAAERAMITSVGVLDAHVAERYAVDPEAEDEFDGLMAEAEHRRMLKRAEDEEALGGS